MLDVQALRGRPIPDLADARKLRVDYRSHAIDKQNPLYDELLVDLATLGIDGRNHFSHAENPPYHERFEGSIQHLLLRKTASARLAGVDASLRAVGLKLFVYDAYRPTAVQAYAHDVWMPTRLRERDASLAGEALMAAVEQYWARPTSDPASPSPHKTGGAVDLTLAHVSTGHPLFMGTIFDDVSALAHTDSFEPRLNSESYSDREAIANRRILYWAMLQGGFAGNPNEWWHYSWGDQMWARLTGARSAVYGPAGPD